MNEKRPLTNKVTEYNSKNKKIYRLQIPEEMGLVGGDVVKFEKINDKEVKLIKLT
ncbi:MAG: hypothetical protein PHP08_00075 [Candidatus Dojkabacteria bacterium]|nr:hypothetical protein [Candidatus Dojkabacteria bacterium]